MIPDNFFRPSKIFRIGSPKVIAIVVAQLFVIGKIIDLVVSVGKGIIRDYGLPDNIQKFNQLRIESDYIFILVIAYAAIYEELAFRLHLRPTLKNLSLSFSLIVVLIGKIVLRCFFDIDSDIFFLNLIRDIGLGVCLFFVWKFALRNWNYLKYYSAHVNGIYLSCVFLWTISHVNNYIIDFSLAQTPLLILIFFNLFSYGWIFSYLRMKTGIVIAIGFHLITNLIKLL